MDNFFDKVKDNEISFYEIFSKKEIVNEDIIFYCDESLMMYDHNFFLANSFKENNLFTVNKIAKENGFNHIKIISKKPIDFLSEKYGFEREILLLLGKEEIMKKPDNFNKNLAFLHLSHSDIKDDLLEIELKHYAASRGVDFVTKKMNRYFAKIEEKNGLDFVACYLENKIVGFAYTFAKFGVTCIDGLLVDASYRHQGIATSLIYYVSNFYKTPLYLHADEDDTPKNLYYSLGFEELSRSYCYLLTNSDILPPLKN